MFRSGWASKPNQTNVLAIWLKRSAFETYLENARVKGTVRGFNGTVRLQWDPDHLPNLAPHSGRRAVQLGLRGIESFADGTDIVQIVDVTEFCRAQASLALQKKGHHPDLMVARERVYMPASKEARIALGLEK